MYAECCRHGVTESFEKWKELMIHRVCLAIEPGACYGDDEGGVRTERLTLDKILGGLKALLSVVAVSLRGGNVYATQQEADRRADICRKCRYNSQMTCFGCSGIIYIADRFLQGREVAGQGDLGACMICSCHLAATCFASKEVLALADKGHEFPEHCWRSSL